LQETISEMCLRITSDPVADYLKNVERILQNYYTTRFRNSKDSHHLTLAIFSHVLWYAVKRVALYLQQVKLCSPEHKDIILKLNHFYTLFQWNTF